MLIYYINLSPSSEKERKVGPAEAIPIEASFAINKEKMFAIPLPRKEGAQRKKTFGVGSSISLNEANESLMQRFLR